MKWMWMMMILANQLVQAQVVEVFFLGGQSNATGEWKRGIETELKKAYGDRPFVIVHGYHPGKWMKKWMTDQPQALFEEDFYREDGTGSLELAWQQLVESGQEPVLRGFFWFQGEGDTGNFEDQRAYAARFNRIRSLIAARFQQPEPPFCVAVIDGNQDPVYDDPEKASGRTREKVEGMRQVLFQLGQQDDGVAFDTRDFKRTDFWHLPKEEQFRAGQDMAKVWYKQFGPSPNSSSTGEGE